MKSKALKQKLIQKRKNIAALGYLLPLIAALLIIVVYMLPLVRFINYNGELTESTSVFSRMHENFSQARQSLFSQKSEADNAYRSFSSLIMTYVTVSSLCLTLGVMISALYAFIGCSHVYGNGTKNIKRVFITFIPNKIVLHGVCVLCLIPALFPHALVRAVDRILLTYSRVTYPLGDIIIWCLIIYIIPIIFSFVTRKHVTSENNIFAKPQKQKNAFDEEADETENEMTDATVYRFDRKNGDDRSKGD